MTEHDAREAAEKIIKENNLDAQVAGSEFQWDDEYPTVTVEVTRADYDRAIMLENYFGDWRISWRQKTPGLVGAEVGDLVLIYCERHADDEDSDVGLVSAKYTEENGEVYYGCRYIKIGLNDVFVNSIYDFELTSEDYGGFPTGFLKVLTPQETIDFLQKKLDAALQAELEKANTRHERSVKNLPALVGSFQKLKRVKCDMGELDEESLPFAISLKR